MIRRQKWLFAIQCVVAIFATVLYAMLKEWDNIMLIWCVTFMMYEMLKLMSIIKKQDEIIDNLIDLCSDSDVAELERQNNVLVANIKYYLDRIKELKDSVTFLANLNRNLMENNSNKGVKNYARHTK